MGIVRRDKVAVLECINGRVRLFSGPASKVENLQYWDGTGSFFLKQGPACTWSDESSLQLIGLLPAAESAIQHVAELAENAYRLYRRDLPELPASFDRGS